MNTVLDKPLTGEQLRNADGYCPRHNTMLLMEEYGNPDSAMICPKCEEERTAQKQAKVQLKYSRATSKWLVIEGERFADFADMKAHTTEFESFTDAFNYHQELKNARRAE